MLHKIEPEGSLKLLVENHFVEGLTNFIRYRSYRLGIDTSIGTWQMVLFFSFVEYYKQTGKKLFSDKFEKWISGPMPLRFWGQVKVMASVQGLHVPISTKALNDLATFVNTDPHQEKGVVSFDFVPVSEISAYMRDFYPELSGIINRILPQIHKIQSNDPYALQNAFSKYAPYAYPDEWWKTEETPQAHKMTDREVYAFPLFEDFAKANNLF